MKWFKFWYIFISIIEIDIVYKVFKLEKKNYYIIKNLVVWLEIFWGMF